eukprot:15364970-Ditylum_brightwellii.AAC.1
MSDGLALRTPMNGPVKPQYKSGHRSGFEEVEQLQLSIWQQHCSILVALVCTHKSHDCGAEREIK